MRISSFAEDEVLCSPLLSSAGRSAHPTLLISQKFPRITSFRHRPAVPHLSLEMVPTHFFSLPSWSCAAPRLVHFGGPGRSVSVIRGRARSWRNGLSGLPKPTRSRHQQFVSLVCREQGSCAAAQEKVRKVEKALGSDDRRVEGPAVDAFRAELKKMQDAAAVPPRRPNRCESFISRSESSSRVAEEGSKPRPGWRGGDSKAEKARACCISTHPTCSSSPVGTCRKTECAASKAINNQRRIPA